MKRSTLYENQTKKKRQNDIQQKKKKSIGNSTLESGVVFFDCRRQVEWDS